jgi:hypothetical protein
VPGRQSSLPTIAVALAPRFGGYWDKFGSAPLNQGPEMGFSCHTRDLITVTASLVRAKSLGASHLGNDIRKYSASRN